jgi:hypothetical protein
MQSHDASHGMEPSSKSSPRRLMFLTIIMIGFAALSWGVSLFSRGATRVSATGTNLPNIFIPAWLTLTIATVIISMWFAKYLLEAERNRDSETAPQLEPAHSH